MVPDVAVLAVKQFQLARHLHAQLQQRDVAAIILFVKADQYSCADLQEMDIHIHGATDCTVSASVLLQQEHTR